MTWLCDSPSMQTPKAAERATGAHSRCRATRMGTRSARRGKCRAAKPPHRVPIDIAPAMSMGSQVAAPAAEAVT
jgi:hypothetical protein